jgi:hypothetical protein
MKPETPWPGPATWRELRRGERRLRFIADQARRTRIAQAFDLEAVVSLAADVVVAPWLDGIEIAGAVRATVTRICGVSLDLFDESLDEAIRVRLVPQGSPNAPGGDVAVVVVDSEEDDPPEEVHGETIDLGALVTEHLALGLSPFPRKPGAAFEPAAETVAISPFAALAALKRADDRD